MFGFIFLCSGETKPECYRYRVFGLPHGKLHIVQQIEPGTKLFLFDFISKMLYGIYIATSKGEMNLEPAAFSGKFPAQVKFKIFSDCLPLPETAFKNAIKDNYQGSKFRQELSRGQVETLVSLFRPIDMPSYIPAAPTFANVAMAHNFAQTPAEKVLPPPMSPSVRYLYLSGADLDHSLPFLSSGLTERREFGVHGVRVQPSTSIVSVVQQAPLPHHNNPYYSAEAPHAYLSEQAPVSAYDPYSSYEVAIEMDLRNHCTGYENQCCMQQLVKKRDTVLSGNVTNYGYKQHLPSASSSHVSSQAEALASSYMLPTSSSIQEVNAWKL